MYNVANRVSSTTTILNHSLFSFSVASNSTKESGSLPSFLHMYYSCVAEHSSSAQPYLLVICEAVDPNSMDGVVCSSDTILFAHFLVLMAMSASLFVKSSGCSKCGCEG